MFSPMLTWHKYLTCYRTALETIGKNNLVHFFVSLPVPETFNFKEVCNNIKNWLTSPQNFDKLFNQLQHVNYFKYRMDMWIVGFLGKNQLNGRKRLSLMVKAVFNPRSLSWIS